MVSPKPGDPTSFVGAPIPVLASPTDLSPAGLLDRTEPSHELTAAEETGGVDWDRIAALPEFKGLLHRKARFIAPASILFLVYYFALPALVGYARPFMERRVGPVNLAYLFALSQFFMAWTLAALYVRAAGVFDRDAKAILDGIHRT